MNSETFNANKAVRILNAHHMQYSAGFYGSKIGGRFFRARVHKGQFQVFNFDFWKTVSPEDAIFHDHNGNNIPLN